jgi:hypothetical protein
MLDVQQLVLLRPVASSSLVRLPVWSLNVCLSARVSVAAS